jgi:hypothetical protein
MLRIMRTQPVGDATKARQLVVEQRLQTGAALILALTVLFGVVLRAGIHNVFLPGWWRH